MKLVALHLEYSDSFEEAVSGEFYSKFESIKVPEEIINE